MVNQERCIQQMCSKSLKKEECIEAFNNVSKGIKKKKGNLAPFACSHTFIMSEIILLWTGVVDCRWELHFLNRSGNNFTCLPRPLVLIKNSLSLRSNTHKLCKQWINNACLVKQINNIRSTFLHI